MQSAWLREIGTLVAQPVMAHRGSIIPLRVGRVLVAVCWLVVINGTAAAASPHGGTRAVVDWIATAVFLVTFTIAVERSATVSLLLVSAAASVVMQFCAPNDGAFVAVIASIAVLCIRMDTATSVRVAALAGVTFLVASVASTPPLPRAQVLSIVPAILFTYLGATATRRLRIEQQRTAQLLEEVVAGREAVIRAAALDERAHLAREMHDVLAHTLSALSIQLEGARMLAEQSPCEPAVVAALDRTSVLAKQGLGEARRAVASLRGEELPGPDLLPELAREFEQDTGIPCRLRVDGEPVDLSPDASLALYRIVQEALTNVRKHAEATQACITLRYQPHAVDLTVENWGANRATPLPGGGYGVRGMRERAELLGGRLEAEPTLEGYRVSVWIPQGKTQSAS
jgi:signal transduction histidine kinase